MSQKKITINDVAESAGVSVTTVSLVLSGKGRISASTAMRVNQAIETLGYVRNRSAAVLRGGDSGVIGLIVRDLSHPFYAEMTAGLTEALEQQGRILFLTQSGPHGEGVDRCFASLVTQGVDGIVLAGGTENAGHLVGRAQQAGIALICASRASTLEQVDGIRPDNQQAAKLATEYLIKRGHHCIARLGGSSHSLTRAERIGGYCMTLLQYGLPFRADWIIECGSRQRNIADLAEHLLHQHPMITAVLCHNAASALGCYFGLQRTGRSVGKAAIDSWFAQQVALVGFGDLAEAEFTDPPLTMITSSAREIGRTAAERMALRLQQPESSVRHLIIPPRLIQRESA